MWIFCFVFRELKQVRKKKDFQLFFFINFINDNLFFLKTFAASKLYFVMIILFFFYIFLKVI